MNQTILIGLSALTINCGDSLATKNDQMPNDGGTSTPVVEGPCYDDDKDGYFANCYALRDCDDHNPEITPVLSYRTFSVHQLSLSVPTWSPDGLSLIYTSYNSSGDEDLRVARVDGSDDSVIFTTRDFMFGRKHIWSPDGNYIAFTGRPYLGLGNPFIGIVHPDGTDFKKIADSGDESTCYEFYDLSWSPDSQRIVTSLLDNGPNCMSHHSPPIKAIQIYDLHSAVSPIDSSNYRSVEYPLLQWGIDNHLYFMDSNNSIFSMNLEGSDVRPIASLSGNITMTLSPDAKKIVSASSIIDVATGTITSVEPYLGASSSDLPLFVWPSWNPNGKELVDVKLSDHSPLTSVVIYTLPCNLQSAPAPSYSRQGTP